MHKHTKIAAIAVVVTGVIGVALAQPPTGPMSFFVTSRGSGNGGNLGGLEGADRLCQTLAQEAGHGARTWRAYLSTQGQNAVNARDRIGPGPWFNVRGAQIAANVEANSRQWNNPGTRMPVFTTPTEPANQIPATGSSPTRHDTLPGSQPDARPNPAAADMTSANGTRSSDQAGARHGSVITTT